VQHGQATAGGPIEGDATGEGCLKSYIREDYATSLSTLDERHAIVMREGVVLLGAGPGPAQRRVEIARLLLVVDKIPKHEPDRVRRDLLDYCHRDALALIRLLETLEGLARVAP
jgi:hypothetical protein